MQSIVSCELTLLHQAFQHELAYACSVVHRRELHAVLREQFRCKSMGIANVVIVEHEHTRVEEEYTPVSVVYDAMRRVVLRVVHVAALADLTVLLVHEEHVQQEDTGHLHTSA